MAGWQARVVRLGAVELTVFEAGAGPPLLILHNELGPPGWQAWHAELAKRRRLVLPVLPGFRGPRLPWVRSVRDLAILLGQFLRDEGLAPVDAIGFSLGGWLGAEMALQNPRQFNRLALVAPFGLKPREGVIADMFLMSSAEYIRACFARPDEAAEFKALFGDAGPEAIEGWEDARVECAQLGWQPYMHDPAMEPLLQAAGDLPCLLVWGEKDAIVPRAAVEAYAQGLPKGWLEVLAGCGHSPELERPEAFVDIAAQFFDAAALAQA